MPYPPRDGGSLAILNLAHSFARLGHDITMLCMTASKHNIPAGDPPVTTHQIRLVTVKVNTGIRWSSLIINLLCSKEPYIAERFVSEDFRTKLITILRSNSFDIIQLEGSYLLPYLDTIRSHTNAVVALRSHNIEHEIWSGISKNTGNAFKRMYLQNLSKRLEKFESKYTNRYDLLVPITDNDQRTFHIMGNQKPVMVCQSGCNTENLLQMKRTGWNRSLFFLGSLDWMPNQQGLTWFALNVFPQLVRKYPDIVFYVAGRNAPRWIISKLKHRNIIYRGEVEDAREFMESQDIMVVPLFSGSGMRVKIIEAMAAGKPVVATTKAAEGIRIVPDENILLADSVGDFMWQTERLINSSELCERISRNAIGMIRSNYDNIRITRTLVDFYQKHIP
ncbi:MAG: glycosyltransferase [Bacteroidales bacterium]|nr:glycosyltransferase [Bacteroidales bacterium]